VGWGGPTPSPETRRIARIKYKRYDCGWDGQSPTLSDFLGGPVGEIETLCQAMTLDTDSDVEKNTVANLIKFSDVDHSVVITSDDGITSPVSWQTARSHFSISSPVKPTPIKSPHPSTLNSPFMFQPKVDNPTLTNQSTLHSGKEHHRQLIFSNTQKPDSDSLINNSSLREGTPPLEVSILEYPKNSLSDPSPTPSPLCFKRNITTTSQKELCISPENSIDLPHDVADINDSYLSSISQFERLVGMPNEEVCTSQHFIDLLFYCNF
jgi:hypothetical protein